MTTLVNQTPPRAFNALKLWLQEHYTSLPKRLQSVAVFALHNPDIIALNTIALISEKVDVTPSTLVRFAKSIGYAGFSDMQTVFQESMRHIPEPYTQRLHQLTDEDQSESTVLKRFIRAASISLDRLEEQTDDIALLQASEALGKARTIYIAGQGRATPVTTYLHYNFIKMGIQAVLIDGVAGSMGDKASLIRQDEALVAISFNPYTANTRELVDACLAKRVPVVALTDSTLSPIVRTDDLHLEVLEEEVGGIRGLSATICLALCLAVETGKYRSQNNPVLP
ncbi:MAG: SIS domain-containing protein [Gammaproteobacteria bacterium]|nr:SIS domain-containing protein [Gammaproteobacteria bacterium]